MFEEIKNLLVEEVGVKEEAVTPEAILTSDLGINSLELADLVMLCEEKFGITIEDEEIKSFRTVGDVVSYLETRTKNKLDR